MVMQIMLLIVEKGIGLVKDFEVDKTYSVKWTRMASLVAVVVWGNRHYFTGVAAVYTEENIKNLERQDTRRVSQIIN